MKCILNYFQRFSNIDRVRENPLYLSKLKASEQTEEMCLEAVLKNPYSLRYIKNQTSNICLTAVKKDGKYLEFCKIYSEEIYLAAVKQNGCYLVYTDKKLLTDKIIREAIINNGWAIRYVPEEKQTEELCILALRCARNPKVCSYPYPTHNNKQSVIQYIKNKTEKICMEAVKINGFSLKYIPDSKQTKELCLRAVKTDGLALRYVIKELKTKEVCLEAINNDSNAVIYIPINYIKDGLIQ